MRRFTFTAVRRNVIWKALNVGALAFLSTMPDRSSPIRRFRFAAEPRRCLGCAYQTSQFSTTRVQLDSAEKVAPLQVSITDAQGNVVQIAPLHKFSDLKGAPQWLSEGLEQMKYPSTTAIQSYTIPVLEDGHDLIGLAPTGSGKTVAFAVPALKNLRHGGRGGPSVLVLAPTRELVQQTSRVFESLSGGAARVCEAYGGAPREIQARRLHSGCDVVVACPGRLKDFLENGDLSLKELNFLVFDEADRLLDMGFQVQLEEIMRFIDRSTRVQTMMWSATWPSSVQDLARTFLSPGRYTIRSGTAGTGLQVNEHINQHIIFAGTMDERIEKLVQLMESGKIDDNTAKLILFVERKSDTDQVAHVLSRRLGIDHRYVGTLHGGLSQRERDRVMSNFKSNHIRLLVATDVASRGLDIPDVTCVVNLEAPKNIDSYCHRIGRTGRAGRSGEAYTFVSRSDGAMLAALVDYLKQCKMDVPSQLASMAEEHKSSYDSARYGRRSPGGRGGSRGSFRNDRQHGRGHGRNASFRSNSQHNDDGWSASNSAAARGW